MFYDLREMDLEGWHPREDVGCLFLAHGFLIGEEVA
jgi:hypothetical protein